VIPDAAIGKLLCVGIRGARPGDALLEADLDACAQAGVGGILLFDVDVPTLHRLEGEGMARAEAIEKATRNILDPDQLQMLIRYLRDRLGEDLLVCIDQEGGRVSRLSPRRGFAEEPTAAEFSKLGIEEQRSAANTQAGRLRALGFDLNFAPCVDLALQAANEIIVGKQRSYGRNPQSVIDAASIVLKAHAEAGVATCLKHFPGHGSSAGDSHLELVDITPSWRREEELLPYRELLGLPGVAVMMGHLLHRDIDAERPASLSRAHIEGLLRTELGFDGLVVTDSIDMWAITDRYTPAEAAVAAIDAGADMVVDAFNLDDRREHPAVTLAEALREAVERGRICGGLPRIHESIARQVRLRTQRGSRE